MTEPDQARDVLARHPVVDGHNDLAWELRVQVGYDLDRIDVAGPCPTLQTDLPRLRAGGVGGQFWSVYVDPDVHDPVLATLEQVDCVRRLVERYAHTLVMARTAQDVRSALGQGRVASLLGMEGGHSIAGSLAVLRCFAALGVRYLTLTHNRSLEWADAGLDVPVAGGLSAFGVEVVRECNRLGVLVDLSHVAATTMHAALAASERPVIFSHSACRELVDHPRNVPDDVLAAAARSGGVLMVTFVPYFVNPACAELDLARHAEVARLALHLPREVRPEAIARWDAEHPAPVVTVSDVADHVEHAREVAGIDAIGIGSDFDGCPVMPQGLSDVSCFPALVAELQARGWSEPELAKLLHGNVLRLLEASDAA